MNINLENFNLSNNICSVKVKVINDDNIFETIKIIVRKEVLLYNSNYFRSLCWSL